MTDRMDGSIRIAWLADGYEAIDVYGRWRPRTELEAFARDVADGALVNRSVADLRRALRNATAEGFDILDDTRGDIPRLILRLHPPPGDPNPDE